MSDFLRIGELKENLVRLIEAKFELGKISIQEKIESITVKILYALFLFILSFMIFILLNILIANILNQLLNSFYWGYIFLIIFYSILLSGCLFWKNELIVFIQKKVEKEVDKQLQENMNRP